MSVSPRDGDPDGEPSLFDLPLQDDRSETSHRPAAPGEEGGDGPGRSAARPGGAPPLLFEFESPPPRPRRREASPAPPAEEQAPPVPQGRDAGRSGTAGPAAIAPRAAWGHRVAAGGLDLLVLAAVGGFTMGGLGLMGIPLRLVDLPALALLLAIFSLVYVQLPLAVFGRTLGMSRLGLFARGEGDRPLSFGQAARRWLAGVLTVALAGLPALAGLAGWWLSDGLSRSRLYRRS